MYSYRHCINSGLEFKGKNEPREDSHFPGGAVGGRVGLRGEVRGGLSRLIALLIHGLEAPWFAPRAPGAAFVFGPHVPIVTS